MSEFAKALEQVAAALESNSVKFGELDAAAGDGDLGITAGKIADGIRIAINSLTGDLKGDFLTKLFDLISKKPNLTHEKYLHNKIDNS